MNLQNTNRPARLYRLDLCAIALCFLFIAMNTNAAESTALSSEKIATSVGKANNPLSVISQKVAAAQVPVTKARTQNAKNHSGDYEIFDAITSIYYDDDLDGHFYGLSVNFDADTVYYSDEVYARLYLSLEGGPWELYYTTEVFTIFGDSADDDYTVDTELYTGYPTGYYDVLVELYDYHYNDLVAEFGPYETPALDELPLEDQQKDATDVVILPPPTSHSHGDGGGSISGLVIGLLLSIALVRANRRRLTRAPVSS